MHRSRSSSFSNSGSSKFVFWLVVRSSMAAKTVVIHSGIGRERERKKRGGKLEVVEVGVVTKAKTARSPVERGNRQGCHRRETEPSPNVSFLVSSGW